MTTGFTRHTLAALVLAGAFSLASLAPAQAADLSAASLLMHGGKGELHELAEKNMAAGKYKKALKYLKKASKKPMDGEMRSRIYSDICAVQALNNELEQALASCDKSLKYDDSNWKAMNNKGVALTALNKKETAHKLFTKALEMSNKNEIILANRTEAASNM
ncbi:tetratricopeptide repeat protein [Emcibacter nanhaiensis]|uniref:Tetratricopeptide repeat protein n=1 Tax=Emcibacter nanhaiensis TaxID=1505037 RepID=A0A501PH01_9PROT|nr:tetratricopeptide repeat protein [Emcibacter nanhaiensis]TPD59743.1 tetratricopeptide repeat protein [Emcibacter nanhaiensis]